MDLLRAEASEDRLDGQESIVELRESASVLRMSLDVLFPGVPETELATLTVAELRKRYVPRPLMAVSL